MIRLGVLSDEERKVILDASFQVLENTGVQVDHPEVFRLLCEAGCGCDEEKRRIFFPRAVVKEKLAPVSFEHDAMGQKRKLHAR